MPAPRPALPFHGPVRTWFEEAFFEPTAVQRAAFPAVASRESALIVAPTGSGKTLAAFLSILDRLLFEPAPPAAQRCRALYISPLKALGVDVERNLRAPLAGISAVAERAGIPLSPVRVGLRSGDTPQAERARLLKDPPDILVTTPESLYLMLSSRARELLASVDTVIVDEIHALLPTKRGAHLFLSLERLERARRPGAPRLQRIGLSATQRPLEEAARALGGFSAGVARPVTLVDAHVKRAIQVSVEVPVEDMSRLGEPEELHYGAAAGPTKRKSIWPSLYPRMVELIRAHRSTMIFCNSRRLAERLAAALNEEACEELAAAHHGSIAREQRLGIEDRLKRGELPAIVATSSLELGIDMGAVDLVLQIESPPSIASGVQRIGRSGHQVGGTPKGVLFPKFRGDLLACAAAAERIMAGDVEATTYPHNPLDVLAQQITAIVGSAEETKVDDLFDEVRGAASFADLSRGLFEGVLDMLAGRYPSDDFAGLRARVTWDRVAGTLKPRSGALRLAIVNGGTIPDRGLYGVFLASADGKSRRVGELDEEMVFETRPGEVFLLGSSSWRVEEITHDRVLVSPAPGEPGKMPFWHGDKPGRTLAFGRQIGALARELRALPEPKATQRLLSQGLDTGAAKNLIAYLREQAEATGEIPSDRTIVVERFPDELGDPRVCVMTPFGAKVHAPWATAIIERFHDQGSACEAVWSDEGMVFRFPESESLPDPSVLFPASAEIEALVVRSIGQTSIFAARFREAAARALLLPRRYPGQRTALWMQRKRSADLLAVASKYGTFPIVLEAYRECLKDTFDLPGLTELLSLVEKRQIRVHTVETERPSPFASSLLFGFVAEFLYEGDAPLAERRAQALRVDPAQLRELLGEAVLRELLDLDQITLYGAALQRTDGKRPARNADELHDLLLSLGDLSLDELRARTAVGTETQGALETLVAELETQRRIVRVRVGGESRYLAVEDASRYRDALGAVLPPGLPDTLLTSVADPLRDLLARFARTHGPFHAEAAAARFGLGLATAQTVFRALQDSGKLLEGELLPGGQGRELCDLEVLRVLRRRSLARLRAEIEPVENATYAAFLPAWQGLTPPRTGREALLAAIAQLEGTPLLASALEGETFPARVVGYLQGDLDALCATGQVIWTGLEPVGPNDGRIALFLSEHEPLLARAGVPAAGALAGKIREALVAGGALFFHDLLRRVGGIASEVAHGLWDLVWAGEVSNDTLLPLRSLIRGEAKRPRRGQGWGAAPRPVGPPGTEGRWWLRGSYRDAPRSGTERSMALARSLLDRYGVLTREAVHAEGIPGGFSAVYPVLKELEERGHVRRGYFVAGGGALQFALPGADDQLRSLRDVEPTTLLLGATDPANAYGASLPWPETPGAHPHRAARALVVLWGGALIGYLSRGEQTLVTYLPADEPRRSGAMKALATALASLVDEGKRRALLLGRIDGVEAATSPLAPALRAAGFLDSQQGLHKRRPAADLGARPHLPTARGARAGR